MSNSNERTEILRLVETGKLSASEGIQLLNTLDRTPRIPPPAPRAVSTRGRWLRIRVTNLNTQAPKVNVNLPLGLVSAGLRIGQRYTPELHGIDLDDLLDEIQRGANGKLVEVEDQESNERVEIFVD
jgi:hypothetical protein